MFARPSLLLLASGCLLAPGCGTSPTPITPLPTDATPMAMSAPTTLTGTAVGDGYGCSVAAAGDVDADGYDDLYVGASGAAASAGEVSLYEGSAGGLHTSVTRRWSGDLPTDGFGASVASAGDVDGDGHVDLLVGAPGADESAGRVYLYPGAAGGPGTTATTTWDGAAVGDALGTAVAGAGDVNGDGYADLLVGAPAPGTAIGAASLFEGSALGASAAPSTALVGAALYDGFGSTVAGAGDVNGDGYDDVVVGAYGADGYRGAASVYEGAAGGLSEAAAVRWSGAAANDQYGSAVAAAGDVNADGYADVVVGAPGAYGPGTAFVYLGSATGPATSADTELPGADAFDYFGASVAGAGDVDADGYDDLLVGNPGDAARTNTGSASLFLGAAGGLATSPASSWAGEATSDAFGGAVTGAGDVNSDGAGDVAVGAMGFDAFTGRIYVYEGVHAPPADADEDGYDTTIDCDDADPDVHPTATEQCDGVDDDCDGTVDGPTSSDTSVWYADADGDGYTDAFTSTRDCTPPEGYAASTLDDCDDADASIHPGGADVPDDGVDQDCNGVDASLEDTAGDTNVDSGADTNADSGSDTGPESDSETSGGAADSSVDPATDAGCGCTTGGARTTGWAAGLLAALAVRRRSR